MTTESSEVLDMYDSSSASSTSNIDSVATVLNIDLTGDIINNYNVIIELGRGSYSIVWLVYSIKDNNFYAMKVQNPEDYNEGKDEIAILKKIPSNEKYINKLVDYFVEIRYEDEVELKFMCSVYSLCCCNLDSMIRKGNYMDGFPLSIVKNILKQICSGLLTIHKKLNGFHGDIKPDNILLCGINDRDKKYIELYTASNYKSMYNEAKIKYMKENNIKKIAIEYKLRIRKTIHKQITDNFPPIDISPYIFNDTLITNPFIKITDFGFYCHNEEMFNESFGTCYYMAPEIILKADCTNMVDIWALGCMLYELVTGCILFDSDEYEDEDGSTTSYHLELITNICGKFNSKHLKYLNEKDTFKKYFDTKGNILKRHNMEEVDNIKDINKLHLLLKENNIDDILLADLLEKMLRLNPLKRASVKDILNHNWLKK